ncbi:hypothetical protein ACLKA7_009923 [Drosophila subpalustris]
MLVWASERIMNCTLISPSPLCPLAWERHCQQEQQQHFAWGVSLRRRSTSCFRFVYWYSISLSLDLHLLAVGFVPVVILWEHCSCATSVLNVCVPVAFKDLSPCSSPLRTFV